MFGAAHRDVQYPPPHKAKQWLKNLFKTRRFEKV